MSSKIAIILEGIHHCQNFKEMTAELGLNYAVYGPAEIEETSAGPAEFAQNLVQNGTEVIITAGKFGELIREQITIPIVTVRRGKISFAVALKEAKRYSDRVAILGRQGVFLSAALQYKALLNEEIQVQGFESEAELASALALFKSQGIEVLITGTRGRRYASMEGFHCVCVPFEREDLLFALREAKHILRYLEARSENTRLLQLVTNNISDGIIVLDGEGNIAEINQSALDIFSLPKSRFLQQSLTQGEFAPISQLPDFAEKNACYGEVLTLNGKAVSVSFSPIAESNENKAFLITITLIARVQSQERYLRNKLYSKGHMATYTFRDIIGTSAAMQQAINDAKRYAPVDSSIFLNGPSGSGKEVFAQSIHNASQRKRQPFVVINCAALPENLLESILFGYEKGAYTGALKEGKKGLFEIAHGGTVFLDEVSEMSVELQSRFLRVLQEKEITPVGSDRVIPINVRIISATNRDMNVLIEQGRFREDLYYRLAVLWIDIPPLYNRKKDIPTLLHYFLAVKAQELALPPVTLSPQAMDYLCSLDYPGNVRQIGNIAERLVVLNQGECISLEHAQRCTQIGLAQGSTMKLLGTVTPMTEKNRILETLQKCGGNRAAAAQILGLSTTTLWRRMKKYELF